MVANHFSGYFYDLGETCGLKFVRAQSDKVDALKEFLNQSDSHFLFYLVRCARERDCRSHPRFEHARRLCAYQGLRAYVRAAEWREGSLHPGLQHPGDSHIYQGERAKERRVNEWTALFACFSCCVR